MEANHEHGIIEIYPAVVKAHLTVVEAPLGVIWVRPGVGEDRSGVGKTGVVDAFWSHVSSRVHQGRWCRSSLHV